MSKKIQVTTITKQANIEIIELSSNFVAKAVRAADEAKRLKEDILNNLRHRDKRENDHVVRDAEGHTVQEPDWENSEMCIPGVVMKSIYDILIAFNVELEEALLGE